MPCRDPKGKRRRTRVRIDLHVEESPLDGFLDALALLAEHYFREEGSQASEPSSNRPLTPEQSPRAGSNPST